MTWIRRVMMGLACLAAACGASTVEPEIGGEPCGDAICTENENVLTCASDCVPYGALRWLGGSCADGLSDTRISGEIAPALATDILNDYVSVSLEEHSTSMSELEVTSWDLSVNGETGALRGKVIVDFGAQLPLQAVLHFDDSPWEPEIEIAYR